MFLSISVNTNMQDENILTSTEQLRGFRSKRALWCSFVEQGQRDMFPLCNTPSRQTHSRLPALLLHERFSFYFPAQCYAEFDWVLDPGRSSGLESRKSMPLQVQEPLTDLTKDHSLLLKCHDMALDCFWITVYGERTSSCCKQCH